MWAVASVKASGAPSIAPAYGRFCDVVGHSVRLIIITAVFAGAGLFRVGLVDYLILVVVLVLFVYLFDSIAVVYVHNMQCHVRSCCPFLHLDQYIDGLSQAMPVAV